MPASVLMRNARILNHLMNIRQMHAHGVEAGFACRSAYERERQDQPDYFQQAEIKQPQPAKAAPYAAAEPGQSAPARQRPARPPKPPLSKPHSA